MYRTEEKEIYMEKTLKLDYLGYLVGKGKVRENK